MVTYPKTINVLSLCSGIGGLDLGVKIAEPRSRVICYVEREAYCAATLVARMEEQTMDSAPIWDDIKTFDGEAWRGLVDCVIGGFPCQPFSNAGKQRGHEDERHLFPYIIRIIQQSKPEWCFFENVSGLLSTKSPDGRSAYQCVYDELTANGYDVQAIPITAQAVGAPHTRERIFIMAHSAGRRIGRSDGDTNGDGGSLQITRSSNDISNGQDGSQSKFSQCDYREETRRTAQERSISGAGSRIVFGDNATRDNIGRRTTTEVAQELGYADGEQHTGGSRVGDKQESITGSRGNVRDDSNIIQERVFGDGYKEQQSSSGVTGGTPFYFPPPCDPADDQWGKVFRDYPELYPNTQPFILRVANGSSYWVVKPLHRNERIQTVGNGVVPLAAAFAFSVLRKRFEVMNELYQKQA